jgi:hypothetical protein
MIDMPMSANVVTPYCTKDSGMPLPIFHPDADVTDRAKQATTYARSVVDMFDPICGQEGSAGHEVHFAWKMNLSKIALTFVQVTCTPLME